VQESALLAAPAVGADPQIFETLYQDATDAPFTLLMSPFALLAQVERDLLVALGDDKALLRP
jgi:hypothetical protein